MGSWSMAMGIAAGGRGGGTGFSLSRRPPSAVRRLPAAGRRPPRGDRGALVRRLASASCRKHQSSWEPAAVLFSGSIVSMLGLRATTRFEKRLGHRFRHRDLLERALTHRSHANEQGRDEHYERLEYLGDAVLGLGTPAWLYRNRPQLPEGELSRLKAQLVS